MSELFKRSLLVLRTQIDNGGSSLHNHDRTARLLAQVMAGQSPQLANGISSLDPETDNGFEPDPVVDSSMFAVFAMDMLGPV